jgi:hypothetical protein
LDTKVDAKVDSLHVKRTDICDLVGYVYIVRVDSYRREVAYITGLAICLS